jgi:hypothetical protein
MRSRLPVLLAVGGGLVVLALLVFAPKQSGSSDPLDPTSTGTSGTKALVMLLRESGASVRVGTTMPTAGTDTALLLSDTTTAADRAQLRRWVDGGGVLVVTDPTSGLVPVPRRTVSAFGPLEVDRGDCDIATLSQLGAIAPSSSPAEYPIPNGSAGCYADATGPGSGAVVVDTPTGQGHVVAIGTASVFTNDALGKADNAPLAVNLLTPRPGTRVAVLWGMTGDGGGAGGGGDLWALVSTGVKFALLELVVAFLVYSWWRARRLGRVVDEPQPVELGGSELTRAHGRLLQQSHDPNRAARLLRADLRRQLCDRLGVPPDASPGVVAEVTAQRAPVERDRVARAVADTGVASDDELLDLAREIDAIRTEVFHG